MLLFLDVQAVVEGDSAQKLLLQSLQSFTTVDPAMSAIMSLVAAEPMSNAARRRRSVMARASQRVLREWDVKQAQKIS